MSNSKKNWSASKATRRSADASKKILKINVAQKKQVQKRILKVVKPSILN
jgi:hypothetical protein